MKTTIIVRMGYLAITAMFFGTIALFATPADAGNAYGRDNHPGKAKGHSMNGGPAAPGAGGGNAHGQLTASMGSLNAAHASFNGLAHANEKSRPGSLRAYMDALVDYEKLDPVYHALEADLIAVKDDITEVEGKIRNVDIQIGAIDAQITSVSNEYAALDPEDEKYQGTNGAELYDADKTALESELAQLEKEKADWEVTKDTLEKDLADLTKEESKVQAELDAVTEALNNAVASAADSLKQAANKGSEITAAVVNAVNTLLDGKSKDFKYTDIVRETEQYVVKQINGSQ